MGQVSPGRVFWITGLSGAGKSSFALALAERLRARTSAVVLVDGDEFREVMGADLGYSPTDRLENARRICRACRCLSAQGLTVVCATMSLFRECHRWNRLHLERYTEVYIEASPATLRGRDRKGLVSSALEGRRDDVVGLGQGFDEPEEPHHRIPNDGGLEELRGQARALADLYPEGAGMGGRPELGGE
ncbi:MAG: adenylyl-sulfate kinase [Planctomycetes bacterium]|nr:adenylyl-sulfate kinase [Planctomycetota bacterium]